MRRLLLLLVVAKPILAQFTEFATTDDGQHLYFTSRLRLKPAGEAASPQTRIYHSGPNGADLFAESSSNTSAGLRTPQVTGDGAVIGYIEDDQAKLAGALPADLGPGAFLQVSRNGRWAVLTPPAGLGPGATLIDLQSNQRTPIPAPATLNFAVASDGTILTRQGSGTGSYGLWKQGEFKLLSIPEMILPVALSDDASTLVFLGLASPFPSTPGLEASGLVAYDLASSRATNLTFNSGLSVPASYFVTAFGMSSNGQWVLFSASDGQVYVGDTHTGDSVGIPLPDGELPSTATLSGSGNAAWIATSRGRILKIGLNNGRPIETFEVVPVTPWFSSYYQIQPGSVVRLKGNLPATTDELTGKILLGGNPVWILSATAAEVDAQIPWEQPFGLYSIPLSINLPSNSPFQQNDLVTVVPFAPAIEPSDPGERTILGLKLVKGDFSGLLTDQPGPGDIIVGYFTGLGSVNGSISTGQPAPLDTLLPIEGQLTCQFQPQQSPAETLFAGLAPGTIGFYQAAFRMPSEAGQSPINGLRCRLSTALGIADFGTSTVIPQGRPFP